jgi:small multidrug resistance pump
MGQQIYLALVFGLVALETIAQYFARKYKDNKEKLWMFIAAVICYIGIAYLLVKTYDFKNIGLVNALWSGLALISVAIVGIVLFDEKFSKAEYIGIAFVLIGTILLGTG